MTITNKTRYRAAVARFREIFHTQPGDPEEAEYDALANAIDEYQDALFQPPRPSAADALRFFMDQNPSFKQARLADKTGISRARISLIVSGKQDPSRNEVIALHEKLGIPLGHLLGVEDKATPPPRVDSESVRIK